MVLDAAAPGGHERASGLVRSPEGAVREEGGGLGVLATGEQTRSGRQAQAGAARVDKGLSRGGGRGRRVERDDGATGAADEAEGAGGRQQVGKEQRLRGGARRGAEAA